MKNIFNIHTINLLYPVYKSYFNIPKYIKTLYIYTSGYLILDKLFNSIYDELPLYCTKLTMPTLKYLFYINCYLNEYTLCHYNCKYEPIYSEIVPAL